MPAPLPDPFDPSDPAAGLSGEVDAVLDAVFAVAEPEAVAVHLTDPDGCERLFAQRGLAEEWRELCQAPGDRDGGQGTGIGMGERVSVREFGHGVIFEGTPAEDVERRTGLRAIQSLPLLGRAGLPLGMLSAYYREPPRHPDRVLALIGQMAAHLAAIVELDRAGRALARQEARCRAALESSADGFLQVDGDLRIVAVNDVYLRRSGYRREEMLALRVTDLDVSIDAESMQRRRAAVLARGYALFETAHRAKSGEIWPVEVSVSACPDASGGFLAFHRDISERRRLQLAVQESEERFRLAMDASNEGLWDWSVDSDQIYYSPGLARMLGYGPAEIGTRAADWLDLIHPDDREAVRTETARMLDRLGYFSLELRLRRKDGGVFWGLSRGKTAARRADGSPVRVVGTLMDINDRKQAEARQRATEERLRLFVEQSPWAQAMLDRDLRYLAVSHRWREDFGLGETDLIGRSHYEIFPEIGEAWKAVHRRALAGETVRAEEDRFERAGGRVQWLRWEVRPFQAGEGEVGGIFIFSEDITERKLAMTVLNEVRDRLADAQQTAHLGSWEYVVGSGRTTWSGEEYAIFGLDPGGPSPGFEELLARHIHPEDVNLLRMAFFMAIDHGREFDLDHRIVRPDGEVRWINTRGRPCRDERGEVERYAGTSHDITHRKVQEEESQRHADLMQALARQQVAIQTAAAFAHELNQPLLAIAAYDEAAIRGLEGGKMAPERLQRALQGSLEQARRASAVLHEFIEHLHTGEVERTAFDLNGLIRNSLDRLRRTDPRPLQTLLDLEAGLPPVLGNRLQTEKVLLNLIQNGVEAMESAGVSPASLVIAVASHGDEGVAQVTVRDSGPGLDAETARRLFEPFFSTKPNGLGLGLAICRSLVEAQGGRLWLDTEAGPGAVFHFTVPFAHE